MPTSSEQDLETWIASRQQTLSADLSSAVMEAIRDKPPTITEPITRPIPQSKSPSWLVASGCLFAGVGKLSLVFHLAF